MDAKPQGVTRIESGVRGRVARRSLALAVGLLLLLTTIACGPTPTAAPTSASSADDATPAEVTTPGAVGRWPRLPGPVDLPGDRPLAVGFLIVDGVYNSELMAPFDIFHHTVFHTEPGMQVFTVSPDGAAVESFEGLTIGAHYGFDDAPPIDVLVVPSAEHSMDTDLENEAMIAWVRNTGARARYVLSLCDGAFVLAAAGLLDGHAVTTFPGDLDAFAERFPHLDLRRDVTFVHDRRMITAAGGARSYDPAMYLVDHLYGDDVTRGVGRGMVLPWPPDGAVLPVTVVGATGTPGETAP